VSQGVVYKSDGEDIMNEILSDYTDYEVTVILYPDVLRRQLVHTGVLTWVNEDDEYQIGNVQFDKKHVDMLIIFE